ncbi:hypothetical protein ACHAWF_006122 [Thalassiosira exigua]
MMVSTSVFELTPYPRADNSKHFLRATKKAVHGSIKLCPVAKALLDTPQVQRLKRLEQLGVSHITYTNCTHKRFDHSLGVMHLAEKMAQELRERQPRLGITEKDVLCVKIAGLLHDLGHGPFSHVYDGVFRTQLEKEKGRRQRDSESCADVPEVMDGWAHEDASLMMIDALLKGLGMEIDESNLDKPLKQIGDGIDAGCFGIWDRSLECEDVPTIDDSDDESHYGYVDDEDEQPERIPLHLVLTSRDWIFVKECIVGGPLPPKGVSIKKFKNMGQKGVLIGRPDPHKEFLYDVICNRHSGLDVDKMDYLARDTVRAFGSNSIADLLPKMTEKAFVAWGACSNPLNCWKCLNQKQSTGDKLGLHTMICYPDKMADNAMSFFEQRFKEHQRLYVHAKTQGGNFMIADIFVLADPFFQISAMNDNDDGSIADLKLPISRAMTNAEVYLQLTDGVLERILNSEDHKLRPAQNLIKRFLAHKIYERIDNQIIGNESWQHTLWDMEDGEIKEQILQKDVDMLNDPNNEIIIEKKVIHHGMKDQNPVSFMRFLPKKFHRQLLNSPENLPVAKQIPDSSYKKPDIFLQKEIRVFCKNPNMTTHRKLKKCCRAFFNDLKDKDSCDNQQYTLEIIEETPQTPTRTLTEPAVTQSPPDDHSSLPRKSGPRRSLMNDVMKRSRQQ